MCQAQFWSSVRVRSMWDGEDLKEIGKCDLENEGQRRCDYQRGDEYICKEVGREGELR